MLQLRWLDSEAEHHWSRKMVGGSPVGHWGHLKGQHPLLPLSRGRDMGKKAKNRVQNKVQISAEVEKLSSWC